jgi:hypothetical protein
MPNRWSIIVSGFIAVANVVVGCGGHTTADLVEAASTGGASGAGATGGSGGMDDDVGSGGSGGGTAGVSSGGRGGSSGATGGPGGVGGTAGVGGSGGTTAGSGGSAGVTGGAGGTTGGSAGATGGSAGGSSGSPGTSDASLPPPDITTTPDVGGERPDCSPTTCTRLGATYCGVIGDGCGGTLDCGACQGTLVCGSRTPNVCAPPCPLCPQIPKCESSTTTITGRAVTGALTNADPLYGALVFVPNIAPGTKLPPLVDGPACIRCATMTPDEALAWAITTADGSFTLSNVPAGTGIPLVVQLGHWRYETTIDVLPCQTNLLPAGTARLPRTQSEGNIPLTAISTGNLDSLECIFRKLGVADSEFSNPAGAGRIHFYRNNGANYDATTPPQADLVGTTVGGGAWNRYDQILFPCEGQQTNETAAALENFIAYANKGGRVITTHFSYTWLYQNAGLATVGTWQVDQMNPTPPLVVNVDTTSAKRNDFARWLELVGALSSVSPPQVSILDPRHDLNTVPLNGGGQRWLYTDTPTASVQHMTVDMPLLAAPDQVCGRVIYSDFHVASAMSTALTFPAECLTGDLTSQEKILAFMLLDLASSCVSIPPTMPPPPPPPPPAD